MTVPYQSSIIQNFCNANLSIRKLQNISIYTPILEDRKAEDSWNSTEFSVFLHLFQYIIIDIILHKMEENKKKKFKVNKFEKVVNKIKNTN